MIVDIKNKTKISILSKCKMKAKLKEDWNENNKLNQINAICQKKSLKIFNLPQSKLLVNCEFGTLTFKMRSFYLMGDLMLGWYCEVDNWENRPCGDLNEVIKF